MTKSVIEKFEALRFLPVWGLDVGISEKDKKRHLQPIGVFHTFAAEKQILLNNI